MNNNASPAVKVAACNLERGDHLVCPDGYARPVVTVIPVADKRGDWIVLSVRTSTGRMTYRYNAAATVAVA